MTISLIKKISVEKIIAFFFSISYFLWLYIIPGIGISLAYFPLMFLSILGIILAIINNKKMNKSFFFVALGGMSLYLIINQILVKHEIIYDGGKINVINLLSFIFFILLFVISFSSSEIMVENYAKYMENIAIIMAAVVCLQCIFYYCFGTSVTYYRGFLLPFKEYLTLGAKQYITSQTMVINGIFRPSAFFLEPAHLSQYCTIGLASLLIKEQKLLNKKAIFVSIGIILTTSGIGIATVFFLWVLSFFLKGNGFSVKTLKTIVLGSVMAIAVFFIAFVFSPAFHNAIARIFVASNGYNSGLEGRLWSRSFLEELSTEELLWGKGFKNIPVYGEDQARYYMTGIIEMLYCQGILGTALFAVLYLLLAINNMKNNRKVSLIIMALFIPFLLGTSCLDAITLCSYIPFLLDFRKNEKVTQECYE